MAEQQPAAYSHEPAAAAMAAAGASAPPSVSVVIPARNAAGTIAAALDSIFSQDYGGELEVVIADGSDTGDLADLVAREYPQVRLVANPEGNTPSGLNYAIAAAAGEIIVRCDAHSELPPGYIGRAVATLERTGAASVGGRQIPAATTRLERAVGLAMTSWLGSGDAFYRLSRVAGPADTVYLGCWRRETLAAVGGFDDRLMRNQDYELHWRLRRHGGMVWFDPALSAGYRPRSGLAALARQYFDYGRWKSATLRLHPASLRRRQLAPPLLVLGLASALGLGIAAVVWSMLPVLLLALALPAAYGLTLLLGAAAIGLRRRSTAAWLLPAVLAAMHLSWGLGFFLPPRLSRRPEGYSRREWPPRDGVEDRLPLPPRQAAGYGDAVQWPAVSVIMPARNAESTIGAALAAISVQDYPGAVEVIVADGSDTGAMADLVRRDYPQVKLLTNPAVVQSAGLNQALAQAAGEIVVRCDAHSELPPGYIRRVVDTLAWTGAASVGGRQRPVATTIFERTVALAMTSWLGAGDAAYRFAGIGGPTDTVYLGNWRRETLAAAGGFDRRLSRNEDYELNWRLRQQGGTVWLDPELSVAYRPRSSVWALAEQYFGNGRWKAAMLLKYPSSLRLRQLAAPLLVLGLAASAGLGIAAAVMPDFRAGLLAAVLPAVYGAGLLAGSAAIGWRRREPLAALLLPAALATMHLSWGVGFFIPARWLRRPAAGA